MKNEACLAHLIKIAENNLKDRQKSEVISHERTERMMYDTKREKNHYHHKGSFVNH